MMNEWQKYKDDSKIVQKYGLVTIRSIESLVRFAWPAMTNDEKVGCKQFSEDLLNEKMLLIRA